MSAAGDYVRNPPPSVTTNDDTVLANLTNTSYAAGTPEVGVSFLAPPSGRVRLTIGGGFRDNGTAPLDRVFLSPQLFEEDSSGEEILTPSVTFRGYLSVAQDSEFQYGSRISLIEDLTPGRRYYLRCMHLATPISNTASADIAARDIIVIPVP